MTHIIDVLRGSKKQKVLDLGHDRLSTYGIGQDRSIEAWRLLGRSLLHQRLVDETNDGYPVLKLNAASWQVLRKAMSVQVAVPKDLAPPQAERSGVDNSPEAALLLTELKHLRKRLADQQSVPPYVVFHESTLRQMAQTRPQTLAEFGRLSGVGSRKLDQYGEAFLAVIRQFCADHGVSSNPVAHRKTVRVRLQTPSDTHRFTLQLHHQGLSIEEIADQRGLKPTTITSHLEQLISSGESVDLDRLVPVTRQQAIRSALQETDSLSLTDLREQLGQTYEFDEIRLVRAAWQAQRTTARTETNV
ncbi:MAG: hypothetical protein HC929_16625 [Leptolyngbyaceae cyanobacterium SM2_5_2]|nr:hypothetical protein [Leptolyngbyaceae cyanobacterium SM2_5_2]